MSNVERWLACAETRNTPRPTGPRGVGEAKGVDYLLAAAPQIVSIIKRETT
jgi:hypothetical protein